jgi:regulatory protein
MAFSATDAAYADGLKLLARRELSELQVRQRLAEKGHDPEQIDHAVTRLRDEHAIDDARVAGGIARTEASTKHRGRLRVRLQIERAGISKATARRAVDEVFDVLDDDAQLEASLVKRLHGRDSIGGDREFQRLYRYLVGQGFDSERVTTALNARKRRDGHGEDVDRADDTPADD